MARAGIVESYNSKKGDSTMAHAKKLLLFVFAVCSAFFLVGCNDGPTFSVAEVEAAKKEAAAAARAEEAKLADGRLSSAKTELSKIAATVVRQGGYSSSSNCNVDPKEFVASSAVANFPQNAKALYKEACVQEVAKLNNERKMAADRAVAKAKRDEQRAAERAKGKKPPANDNKSQAGRKST